MPRPFPPLNIFVVVSFEPCPEMLSRPVLLIRLAWIVFSSMVAVAPFSMFVIAVPSLP